MIFNFLETKEKRKCQRIQRSKKKERFLNKYFFFNSILVAKIASVKLNLTPNCGAVNGSEKVLLDLNFPLKQSIMQTLHNATEYSVLWDGECIKCETDGEKNYFVTTPPHPEGFVDVYLNVNGQVVTEKADFLYISNSKSS